MQINNERKTKKKKNKNMINASFNDIVILLSLLPAKEINNFRSNNGLIVVCFE